MKRKLIYLDKLVFKKKGIDMITKANSEQLSPFLQKLTSLTEEELERTVKDYFESYLKKELENVEFKNGIQKIVNTYKVKYKNNKKVDRDFYNFVYYENHINPFGFIPILLFVDNEIITTYPLSNSLENQYLQFSITSSEWKTFDLDFLELLIKYIAEIVSVYNVVKYITNIIYELIKKQLILVGKNLSLSDLKELTENHSLSLYSLSDNQLNKFYYKILEKECIDGSPYAFKELFLFKQIAKELQSRKQNKKED